MTANKSFYFTLNFVLVSISMVFLWKKNLEICFISSNVPEVLLFPKYP